MVRKLYLHIGPPKTATSAIQHTLQTHRNSVVLYPSKGIAGGCGHAGLVWAVYGRGGKRAAQESAACLFFDVGREIRESNLDVVISSEFFTLPYGRCLDLRPFIATLSSCLDGLVLDIEVLFACRDHLSWAGSIYNQRVKTMNSQQRELRAPDEFLVKIAPQLRYRTILGRLRDAGLKGRAINYHPEHDWLYRFLQHIGFTRQQIPEVNRRNESLSRAALIAKLAANRAIKDRSRLRSFLAEVRALRQLEGATPIFSSKAIAEADRHFAKDRKFVLGEMGIRLPTPPRPGRNDTYLTADEMTEIASVAAGFAPEGETIVRLSANYRASGTHGI